MNRLLQMRLVRQEEPNGCLIACMAMAVNASYREVAGWFPRVNAAEQGLTHYHLFEFFAAHGFAYQHINRYCWTGEMKERASWPLPLVADATLCRVDGGKGGEWSHGIMVMRDGRALDPAHGEHKWSDYAKCGSMMPLFDLRA